MSNRPFDKYEFQHLIDYPNCDCVYCSTRDKSTGRARLFLVFNERRRIYVRNGVKNSWEELTDEGSYNTVRVRFNEAVVNDRIPYLTTMSDTIEDFNHKCLDETRN